MIPWLEQVSDGLSARVKKGGGGLWLFDFRNQALNYSSDVKLRL